MAEVQRKQKKAPAGITETQRVHDANTAEVNRSIDEWRASQGLPPIDRSKKARTDGDQ